MTSLRWEDGCHGKPKLSHVLSTQRGVGSSGNVTGDASEESPADDQDRRERAAVRRREEAKESKD